MRTINLQWGAQLTVDFLVLHINPKEIEYLLCKMHDAGCNYIYLGLESLSHQVISNIHKNTKPNEDTWQERVEQALCLLEKHKIRSGCSLLFGLPGETIESINETIRKVSQLIKRKLIFIASPNILTYHPSTPFSSLDGIEEKLDYSTIPTDVQPPYSFFEEAYPQWVSIRLTEQMIWEIHNNTQKLWGNGKNSNPMPEPTYVSIKSD
jgi:radical SAM superfamily enzyme YgiQ (UPF0313 family)